MRRMAIVLTATASLAFGTLVAAQDSGTPTTGGSTEMLCATPMSEASVTPVKTVVATPLASPGASPQASPFGMFPCATPAGSPQP